jgi:uncharacterized protein (TIGR02421 family)
MTSHERIPTEFIETARLTLSRNRILRRRLPGWGQLHIDRQQPFLCLYRRPPAQDDVGTDSLLLSQASFLLASGNRRVQASLRRLVKSLVAELVSTFGCAIILEIWSTPPREVLPDAKDAPDEANFRIVAPAHAFPQSTLETLEGGLVAGDWPGATPGILLHYTRNPAPPFLSPILTGNEAQRLDCTVLGLEIPAVYRQDQSGPVYPSILRGMRHELGHVLKQSFYSFAHAEATYRPAHYHELGRRAMTRVVWETDRQLGDIGDAFDMLLSLTPTNSEAAWSAFRRARFGSPPEFHYRPLTVDPASLKYRLYKIPLERIEDPALHAFFEAKRDELDRQISMLGDRETRNVLFGSLQLYGAPDSQLVEKAKAILASVPPHTRDDAVSHFVDAQTFARHAEAEILRLKNTLPQLSATVQVRDDVPGLMVSKGHLLIGSDTRVAKARIAATLQHEVGTHILTFYNGQSQPFRLLHTGSAGYEELQEGVAVLAEYLVGGLSRPRLRLLAGRVLAVDRMVSGAGFIETFRMLHDDYEFSQKTAYTISMRVHRGGGLTKDVVYLRGVNRLLNLLAEGAQLADLLIGKISFDDTEVIEELLWRGVLTPPLLRPAYLDDCDTKVRLTRIASHNKGDVLDLVIGELQ